MKRLLETLMAVAALSVPVTGLAQDNSAEEGAEKTADAPMVVAQNEEKKDGAEGGATAEVPKAEVKKLKPIPNAEESFPMQGLIRTTYRANHSNFQSVEGDTDLGFGVGTLQAVFFWVPNATWNVYGSIWFDKTLHEGIERPPLNPSPSTRSGTTQARDVLLGAQYVFASIKSTRTMFNTSMNVSLPTSQLSRTSGQLVSVNPTLQAVQPISGGVVVATLNYFYNLNEDPTQQIDCGVAPQNCVVSGQDMGAPLLESGWSAGVGVNYRIIPGLLFRGGYTLTSLLNSVDIKNDEFTADIDGAQDGRQITTLHSTNFGLQYALRQPGGGANAALNDLGGGEEQEDSILQHLQFAFTVTTLQPLYDRQGDGLTLPLFDFETDTHTRTQYILSITYVL